MEEMWLPVPGWEGLYEVSNFGNIRSLPREAMTGRAGIKLRQGRVLKPGTYKDGHKHVTLSRNGNTKCYQVHKLVLLAFVGPCPEGLQVRHLNGIPDDNHLENLVYGTPKENMKDRDEEHGKNHNLNKTHCPQEHEYDEENTYVVPTTGVRQCKACRDGGRPSLPCIKCDKPARTRKLCAAHYAAWRRSQLTPEQFENLRKRDREYAQHARDRKRQSN